MRTIPILFLAAALAACAAVGEPSPGCSGPRRPANPHGSVLSPDAPPPSPPTQAPQCRSAAR